MINKTMKKPFNFYIDEEKLKEIKARAKAQDVPLSTYIKTKLFPENKQTSKQEI